MWWAAVPKAYWPEDAESLKSIDDDWDPQVGDARQELVLIGIDMDEVGLRGRLDACLLTDAEMSKVPEAWHQFTDPFPAWGSDDQGTEQALASLSSQLQLPHDGSSATCSTSPVAPRSTNATTPACLSSGV